MKYVLVIGDGMADTYLPQLGGQNAAGGAGAERF